LRMTILTDLASERVFPDGRVRRTTGAGFSHAPSL